jgi:hypothetical protein
MVDNEETVGEIPKELWYFIFFINIFLRILFKTHGLP